MELDEIRAFLALATHGSLSEASRQVGMPRNTLRRRVEGLEARLGAPLLVRDQGQFTVTAVGRELVARGGDLLADADALATDLQAAVRQPEGRLRVLLPVGTHPITAALVWRITRARHPTLRLELRHLEDPVGSLDADGDFAMHWGASLPAGPEFARRVGVVPLRLLATRSYVEAQGLPVAPGELVGHEVFCLDHAEIPAGTLPLRAGGSIPVAPSILSTNVIVGWEAARLGAGIALAPNVRLPGDGWPEEDVVVVMEEVVGLDLPLWIVGRGPLSSRPALQPLLDDMAALLGHMGVGTS